MYIHSLRLLKGVSSGKFSFYQRIIQTSGSWPLIFIFSKMYLKPGVRISGIKLHLSNHNSHLSKPQPRPLKSTTVTSLSTTVTSQDHNHTQLWFREVQFDSDCQICWRQFTENFWRKWIAGASFLMFIFPSGNKKFFHWILPLMYIFLSVN
jgi:hypothetical protein